MKNEDTVFRRNYEFYSIGTACVSVCEGTPTAVATTGIVLSVSVMGTAVAIAIGNACGDVDSTAGTW